MAKFFSILVCLVILIHIQGAAQVVPRQDSLKIKAEIKRISDSTRIAIQKIAVIKRQDSIAAVIQQRQSERKREADSIRVVKKLQRDALRKQNKEFTQRKREREHIRDSVQKASAAAAKGRKAYRKSLKKQGKKTVKRNAPAQKTTEQEAVAKEKQRESKLKQPDTKKEEQAAKARKKKEEKIRAQVAKDKADSLTKAIKIENRKNGRKVKSKDIVINEDTFDNSSHYQTIERVRKPPIKKQSYFAFQIGSSNYLGDLGGNSRLEKNILGDVGFKENTYFYGFSFTQLRREALGIRLSYVFGEISGSDKNTFFKNTSDPSYARFIRNLDFKTNINEGSLMFELYPLKFLSYTKKLHHSYLQPYGLIGLGRFSFNPQGSYFDTDIAQVLWYDLQPLSLEGQGMREFPDRSPYKLTQWNIPHGLGFNYEISPTVTLGMEYVGRILFTDYLDDVSTNFINPDLFGTYFNADNAKLAADLSNKSKFVDAGRAYNPGQQRGNPENNDFYFSISARLIIKISKDKSKVAPTKKFDALELAD